MTRKLRSIDPALRAEVIDHVETCTGLKVPNCPWNLRYITNCLGYAKTKTWTGEAVELAIASTAWKYFSDAERWTSLVHECCHLLHPHAGHGASWQASMLQCGQQPSLLLNSPTFEAYQRKRATKQLVCDCAPHLMVRVTPQKLTAMRKKGMERYRCTSCNARLTEPQAKAA